MNGNVATVVLSSGDTTTDLLISSCSISSRMLVASIEAFDLQSSHERHFEHRYDISEPALSATSNELSCWEAKDEALSVFLVQSSGTSGLTLYPALKILNWLV